MALYLDDVSGWARLTGRALSDFDIEVLALLDRVFWKVKTDKPETAEGNQSLFKQMAELAERSKKLKTVTLKKKDKDGRR